MVPRQVTSVEPSSRSEELICSQFPDTDASSPLSLPSAEPFFARRVDVAAVSLSLSVALDDADSEESENTW
eukprot:886133-Rhodomonas_salina.2